MDKTKRKLIIDESQKMVAILTSTDKESINASDDEFIKNVVYISDDWMMNDCMTKSATATERWQAVIKYLREHQKNV